MSRNIIAILRGVKPDEAVAIAETILESGIARIEVPLNSPRPFDSIAAIAGALDREALVGAGTVIDVVDVRRVKDAGGQLIVSPDCNPGVIRETKRLGMQSFPGVLTPTECFKALRAGADGLKIFPADLLGTEGVKAIRAVLPKRTIIYAVGGVSPEDFDKWLTAGVIGFGIGSNIYSPGLTAQEVRNRAEKVVVHYDRAISPSKK